MTRDVFILIAALFGVLGPLLVLVLVRGRRFPDAGDETAESEPDTTSVDDAFRDTGAGIAVFDTHERLTMATPRYAELLGVAHVDMAPGTPLSVLLQIVAHRGAAADAVGREDTWIEESLHAHRRGAGPSLQRGRGDGWLCVAIGSTDNGGRVHLVTDVSALGQVRRQVAEEVRRLARQGAFDAARALAAAPEPARDAIGEVTAELSQQVRAFDIALQRLVPANDEDGAMAGSGLRDAVGGVARLVDRYDNVERLPRSA